MKDRGGWTVGGLWECLDTGSSNVVSFRETLENLRLDSHRILTPLSQQVFSRSRYWGEEEFSSVSLGHL